MPDSANDILTYRPPERIGWKGWQEQLHPHSKIWYNHLLGTAYGVKGECVRCFRNVADVFEDKLPTEWILLLTVTYKGESIDEESESDISRSVNYPSAQEAMEAAEVRAGRPRRF